MIDPYDISTHFSTPPLPAHAIRNHQLFPVAERWIALRLIAIHDGNPKIARLKSSHRKWLITQSLFALSSMRDPEDPLSGLTAARLMETVITIGAASRNTAAAFLQEMLAYRFLRDVPDNRDRRVRVLEPTEVSIHAMRGWFFGHLEALDLMDGGNRAATLNACPSLFRPAQRLAAFDLLENPDWRDPRPSIGHFLWSEGGGMVLHDLIARVPDAQHQDNQFLTGPLALADLAAKYLISNSNLKRIFSRVQAEGLAGWTGMRRQGQFWMSRSLVEDYYFWQGTKFAAIDQAIRQAACDDAGTARCDINFHPRPDRAG